MKSNLLHKRSVFPKGHPITSIMLREVDGRDELEAIKWAEARNGKDEDNTAVVMEQVRCSIVKVDDVEVTQPYTGLESWPARTRSLVLRAWMSLNSVDEEETKNFLASAENLAADASK